MVSIDLNEALGFIKNANSTGGRTTSRKKTYRIISYGAPANPTRQNSLKKTMGLNVPARQKHRQKFSTESSRLHIEGKSLQKGLERCNQTAENKQKLPRGGNHLNRKEMNHHSSQSNLGPDPSQSNLASCRDGNHNHFSGYDYGSIPDFCKRSSKLHTDSLIRSVTMLPSNQIVTNHNSKVVYDGQDIPLLSARRNIDERICVNYRVKDIPEGNGSCSSDGLNHKVEKASKTNSDGKIAKKAETKSAGLGRKFIAKDRGRMSLSRAGKPLIGQKKPYGKHIQTKKANQEQIRTPPPLVRAKTAPFSAKDPKLSKKRSPNSIVSSLAQSSPSSQSKRPESVPPLKLGLAMLSMSPKSRMSGVVSSRRRGNRMAPDPYLVSPKTITPRPRIWEAHPNSPGVDETRFKPPRTPKGSREPNLSLTQRKGALRYSITPNPNTPETVRLMRQPVPSPRTYRRLLPYSNVKKRSEAWAKHVAKGPRKPHPEL